MEAKLKIAQKRLGSYADFKSESYYDKEFIFVLNHVNNSPSYKSSRGQGMHYPPSFRLLLWDQVYDKNKQMMRIIRYIPGEMSIYKDEQTPDDKIPKKEFSLEFINGEKLVDGTDTLLIKYLMTTNRNGSIPTRDASAKISFFTVDPGKGLESVIESDELLAEAQHFCYKGEWDLVAAYAMIMGLPPDRDVRETRYALRQLATANPKKFMDGLNSPKMIRKYYAMEAIKEGVLEKNTATNTINWKGGAAIVQAPIGKDLVDELVDASFTPNGEKIWDAIIGILRPEKAVKPIKTELQNIPSDANVNKMTADLQPVLTQLTTSDHSDLELDEFIADGLKKEVIIKSKPMWHAYNGKKYAGKDKLMSALRGDPKLVSLLKKDLNR